jgi:sugar diacid utilization regulator
MYISVADALKLPSFYGAQILAGSGGLDRQISRISVVECPEFPLDADVAGKDNLLFKEGDFFISSLYAIKDSPGLLYDTIKLYNRFNSSGMCIVNRYFDNIPEEVADYANDINFPIIMVKRNTAYADMITDVSRAILSLTNNHVAISIINEIRNENDSENIISLAYTLNHNFYNNIIVFCLRINRFVEDKIRFLITSLNNTKDSYCVQYYNNILIFVSSESKFTNKDIYSYTKNLKNTIEKHLQSYSLGLSNSYSSLKKIKDCIEESLIACRVSNITKNKIEIYNDIGAYKILLDIKNDETLERFYNELIKPIKEYDEEKNGMLLETLLTYVKNDGDMKKTADDLFQHQNTVRYRIQRIKELLNLEKENIKFYENISLAFKIYKIMDLENNNKY